MATYFKPWGIEEDNPYMNLESESREMLPPKSFGSTMPYTVDVSRHPEFGLAERMRLQKEKIRQKGEVLRTGEPSLWEEKKPLAVQKMAEGLIPFLPGFQGVKEWRTPETMMEIPSMIAAGALLGAVGKPIVSKLGNWFRLLTNKERGVVAKSLDDMLGRAEARSKDLLGRGYSRKDVEIQLKQEGLTEPQILSRWENPTWRAEALARRGGTEAPSVGIPPKPAPVSMAMPAGPVSVSAQPPARIPATIPPGLRPPETPSVTPESLPPGLRPPEPKVNPYMQLAEEVTLPEVPPEAKLEGMKPSPAKFIEARSKSKRPEFITPYTSEQLKDFYLYLKGDTGYALTPDMDLVNVFNNSNVKGAGISAVVDSISKGAKTLDCFDGFLPKYYREFGFDEISRSVWNDEFAPKNWELTKYGKPDIVYMQYEGQRDAEYLRRVEESVRSKFIEWKPKEPTVTPEMVPGIRTGEGERVPSIQPTITPFPMGPNIEQPHVVPPVKTQIPTPTRLQKPLAEPAKRVITGKKEPWQMNRQEVTEEAKKLGGLTAEQAQKAVDSKIDELMAQGKTFEEADASPEVKELFRRRDIIDNSELHKAYSDILQRINKVNKDRKDTQKILEYVYRLTTGHQGSVYFATDLPKIIKTPETGERLTRHVIDKWLIDNRYDESIFNPYISGWSAQKINETKAKLVKKAKDISDAVIGYFERGKPKTGLVHPQKLLAEPAKKVITSKKGAVEIGAKEPGKVTLAGWYFPLQRTIESKMGNAASVEQVRALVTGAGVKEDEIKWSGMEDYLSGKDKVSKKELMDYLKENQVEVKEIVKGGALTDQETKELDVLSQKMVERKGNLSKSELDRYDELTERKDVSAPKFPQKQLPGGENYREVLLQWGDTTPRNLQVIQHGGSLGKEGKWYIATPEGEPVSIGYRTREDALRRIGDVPQWQYSAKFRGPHWDEPDILSSLRRSDRVDVQGKKGLLIEELQSDWHQAGRKKGYKTGEQQPLKYSEQDRQWLQEKGYSEEDIAREELRQIPTEREIEAVPQAPFSKTWHEMTIRRAIMEAVNKNEDRVYLTTGEQQVARYDLSKQVDRITWNKEPTKGGGIYVAAHPIGQTEPIAKTLQPNEIAGFVGKEIAKKIIEGGSYGTLRGIDLKVGGEGMKGYYDKSYFGYLKDLARKYKSNAGMVELKDAPVFKTPDGTWGMYVTTDKQAYTSGYNTPEEAGSVYYLDITPAMKNEIKKNGMNLFSLAPVVGAGIYAVPKKEK